MPADRSSIIKFLDALSRQSGDLFHAIEEAAVSAFPGEFFRISRGVAVRGGGTTPVLRVLELLGISDADAEVLFNHLPDDPKVLAGYLRPRVVEGTVEKAVHPASSEGRQPWAARPRFSKTGQVLP